MRTKKRGVEADIHHGSRCLGNEGEECRGKRKKEARAANRDDTPAVITTKGASEGGEKGEQKEGEREGEGGLDEGIPTWRKTRGILRWEQSSMK